MLEALLNSSCFCIALTVAAFGAGAYCQRRWKLAVLNPILLGAAMVMLVLAVLDIPVEHYTRACRPLTFWMTPATICLAVSFAEQLQRLKDRLPAIFIGVTAGTLSSLCSIAVMARLFGFNRLFTVSLLPKSITTAIGVALSEQAGGIGALTTAAIILTGIFGNIAGPFLAKRFRIDSPEAQGVAFGTASHVIGTSKAVSVSAAAGAVSSLALTLAGILTTVAFALFSQ